MNCDEEDNGFGKCVDGYLSFSQADRWIVSKLQRTLKNIERAYSEYRFDLVAQELYQFIWDEFCDWYLEFAKVQIQQGNESEKRATRRTLLSTLESILRLAHPVIPFITEEIWQIIIPLIRKDHESITLEKFPKSREEKIDEHSIEWVSTLKKLIDNVRSLRSEMNISPANKIPLALSGNKKELEEYLPYLISLAKLSDAKITADLPEKEAPVAIVSNYKVMLNIEVDKEAEAIRLKKEIEKAEIDLNKAGIKLNNKNFVSKAPKEIIKQEEERLKKFTEHKDKLVQQLKKLQS
jgi:valyl-tRNA synthetase